MSGRKWADPDGKPVMIVRCRGRRILAVLPGDPTLFTWRGMDGSPAHAVLDGERVGMAGASRDWGSNLDFPCPVHNTHVVSGPRLREVLDRLVRPGKVVSVDVSQVVDKSQ